MPPLAGGKVVRSTKGGWDRLRSRDGQVSDVRLSDGIETDGFSVISDV